MRIAIALGSFQGPRIVSLCAKIYIWGDYQVFALVALWDYRITSRVQIEGREKLLQAQHKAVGQKQVCLSIQTGAMAASDAPPIYVNHLCVVLYSNWMFLALCIPHKYLMPRNHLPVNHVRHVTNSNSTNLCIPLKTVAIPRYTQSALCFK